MGDIHGQLQDLYYVLKNGGSPLSTTYLFLGDYVDRGDYGIEVLIILYVLKLQFPNKVFLLRGNHESERITAKYGFRRECLTKYGNEVLELCLASFLKLPLAAIVNGTFFCVHGGLSPELKKALDLNKSPKIETDIPGKGLLCDLMWSDPIAMFMGNTLYLPNEERECSYYFGPRASKNFLEENRLMTIIRAHQCVINGYECFTWGNDFPVVVTIFSAEKYGPENNMGSFMTINVGSPEGEDQDPPVRLYAAEQNPDGR